MITKLKYLNYSKDFFISMKVLKTFILLNTKFK